MVRGVWLSLLLIVPTLFACTPESRNNLPDENRVAGDSRLLGLWRAEPDSDDFRIQITQRDPLEFAVVTSETSKTDRGGRIHIVEYNLRFFDVDGRQILAIQELNRAAGDDPSWRFATYRFDEANRATLSLMSEDRIRQLVQGGQLPGTIRGADTQLPEVLIIASRAKLVELIRSEDPAKLFTARVGPFVRVGQ